MGPTYFAYQRCSQQIAPHMSYDWSKDILSIYEEVGSVKAKEISVANLESYKLLTA